MGETTEFRSTHLTSQISQNCSVAETIWWRNNFATCCLLPQAARVWPEDVRAKRPHSEVPTWCLRFHWSDEFGGSPSFSYLAITTSAHLWLSWPNGRLTRIFIKERRTKSSISGNYSRFGYKVDKGIKNNHCKKNFEAGASSALCQSEPFTLSISLDK